MNFFITLLAGISISFDIICVHLAATSFMTVAEYSILAFQILILVYNIITVLGMFFNTFQNILRLLYVDIIIRILSTIFYVVIAYEKLSNISILFYILCYLNVAFSMIKIINKSDSNDREIVPLESLTIVIESEVIQNDDNCSICLESLNNTEVYKTKCSHIFHTSCMKKYAIYNFNEGVKCPNCREIISKSSRTSIIFD